MSTSLNYIETKIAEQGVLVLNHSRAAAFRPEKYGVKDSCAMIRVEDPGVFFKNLVFEEQFSRIRRYQFHDADAENGMDTLISEHDASDIVSFFESLSGIRLLVVHCAAGRCRSAAIAAAYCYFIGDGKTENEIHYCGLYNPNMYVYNMIVKEIHRRKYGQP